MTELQTKQAEFLKETIEHFNLNNRGMMNGKCSYEAGCAIGRKIADKDLCRQLDERAGPNSPDSSAIDDQVTFSRIPLELQQYGVRFLSSLQRLHDVTSNWNNDGLTMQGYNEACEIAAYFGLDLTIEKPKETKTILCQK